MGYHNGMCYRKMMNVQNVNPWVAFPHDVKPTLVQLFSVLFPKGYIESTDRRTIGRRKRKNICPSKTVHVVNGGG